MSPTAATTHMGKRLGEINSESDRNIYLYMWQKREKTSGRASMVRVRARRRRLRFAHVGERLFYHCMSMGNNLVCFHSHALFWSVCSGCQTAAFRNNFLCLANLDFSFSQRALNKAEGCCVAQGNTRNTGCLSWLVSEVSAASIPFHTHTHTPLVQTTHTHTHTH